MKMNYNVLWLCGFFEYIIGCISFILMVISIYDGKWAVQVIFRIPDHQLGLIAGNSWAQTAVAFGMHAYADIANGLEQMNYAGSRKKNAVPSILSVWNTTKFIISFLWCLQLIKGIVMIHGYNVVTWPPSARALVAILLLEAVLLRPAAVYCQRRITDAYPPFPNAELKEWNAFTRVQKICRCVFYYEAVISGCSGAAYFLFPELFIWLYGLQKFSDDVALWSLAGFGANVMAFGLYQMSSEIDTRTGHIIWWLLLDIVWMYLYWIGIQQCWGPWNPFLLTGANIWCHLAFHADSSLALARIVFLVTLITNGRTKLHKD